MKQTSIPKPTPLAIALMSGLAMSIAGNLLAAPVIYEPFDDSNASLTGNAVGTGLSGTWTASSTFVVTSGSPTWGSLATSGNQVTYSGAAANSSASASLGSALSSAGLLADRATLWWGMVVNTPVTTGSNPDTGFAIGASAMGSGNLIPLASGQGIGWNIQNGLLRAAYWTPSKNISSGVSVSANTKYFIVCEMIWGTNGANDTINVYLPDESLNLGAIRQTISANLNQSTFSILSTGMKSNTGYGWDEIRFGATYADVTPDPSDATAPTLASTVPVHTGTGADGILQATFNEPIRVGTGDIRIYSGTAPGTLLTTITVPSPQVSVVGPSTLKIVPSTAYAPSTQYYVEIDSGVVEDRNSNDFVGYTGDTTWSFTTGSTAPTVASITSQFGAADIFVGLSSELYTVTFDKPMSGSSIDATDFGGAVGDTGTVTIGTVTQFDPYTFLVPVIPQTAGTFTFTVLSANTVNDLTGNALAANASGTPKNILASTQVATITGTAGGADSWITAANWSGGFVPVDAWAAKIGSGVTAQVTNTPPTYAGGLTFETNSQLDLKNTSGSLTALGSGPITMNTGSTLILRRGAAVSIANDIAFAGNATLTNVDNTTDNQTRTLNGTLSGSGQLTYSMRRGNTLNINGTNTLWSGGFVANCSDIISTNYPQGITAGADDAFGSGDVTLNDGVRLVIPAGKTDTIDDNASLNLNGRARDGQKLVLGSDETVGQLTVDGNSVRAGTYTSASNLKDQLGNPLIAGAGILTVVGPADTTNPTVVSISSPPAGGPIYGTPTIPYTVIFSEWIDPTSVDATDFKSIGSAPYTIGTFTDIGPGYPHPSVYTVEVIPSGPGTVQFQVQGPTIQDIAGNALPSLPVTDTTVYTLAASAPTVEVISLDGTTFTESRLAPTNDSPLVATLDASASDKLVVIVTGEHGNPGDLNGKVLTLTYSGQTLIKVVDRDPTAGPPLDQLYNEIWYLDNPGDYHESGDPNGDNGIINATVTTRGTLTAFALSNTVDGPPAASIIGPQNVKSVQMFTSPGSFVVACLGMGGDGNTADTQNVNTVPDLIERSATKSNNSSYDGHVTGTELEDTGGLNSYAFTGGSATGVHTIAAVFLPLETGGGNPYDTWVDGFDWTGFTSPDLTRTGDPDGDGFTNEEEFLFGTAPNVGNGSLSTSEKSGTDLIIRWKERTSGVTYALLQSGTLNNDWVPAVGATLENDGAAVGDYQPRKATVAIGSGSLFYRVQGVEN